VYEQYTKILNFIDFDLAKQIATNVGGIVPDKPGKQNRGQKSKALSQTHFAPKEPTIESRRIAVLVADGFNLAEVQAVVAALKSAKAMPFLIGPRRGEVYPAGVNRALGKGIKADHHYEGARSTLFDAVYIPSGEHVTTLANNGRTVHWVREAFGHCKAIGAVGEAVQFLRDVVNLPGVEFQDDRNSDSVKSSYGVVTAGSYGLKSAATDVLKIGQGERGFTANFAFAISQHRCFERELDGLTAKVAY